MAEPSKLMQFYFQFTCWLIGIGFIATGILLCFLKTFGITAKYANSFDMASGIFFGLASFGISFFILKHKEKK
jgi:hypothetical protein